MLVDDLKVPRVLNVPSGSTDEDVESSFDESRARLLPSLGISANSMFRPRESVNDRCG
jgi:hypothetical protein